MKSTKYTASKAAKDLDAIDKKHESGKCTQAQHDKKSMAVLLKLKKAGK